MTLRKIGSSKLQAVKAIKFATGLGLKEAKEFVDKFGTCDCSYSAELDINVPVDKLREDLFGSGYEFHISDIKDSREAKFISLGLGSDLDKVELLSSMMADKMYQRVGSEPENEFKSMNSVFLELFSDIEDMSVIDDLLKKLNTKDES